MRSRLVSLWGRITGADVNKTFPQQQGQSLNRVADMFVASPYGLYANLPQGQLFKMLDEEGRVIMGVTVARIAGVAQDEVVLYHPITNSKIHFKNNGDIDIDTLLDVGDDSTQGDINITNKNLNITCTENVVIDCINATVNATVSDNVNTVTANITATTTNVISTAAVNVTTALATITAPTTNIIATAAVNVTSPLTTITGDLTVTGNTILGPSLIAGAKELVNHLHPAGTPPGNTGVNT